MTSSTTMSRELSPQPRAGLWWNAPFRMFQTNIREIDTADLDVRRVLDRITSYGANAWLLSVGGIISNYPTDLPFQTRNPGLAQRERGDLVGEAIDGARARGVRVLARMDFSKIPATLAEEHPDWCYQDPQGRQQVYNGLVSVCPSGDYYQHAMFEVLGEIVERYEIDGFFFNWLTYGEIDYSKAYRGVCQCLACRRTYAAQVGGELPVGPESPGYPAWQRWSTAMLDDLTARAREFIAERRPSAPLILGETSDIVFHEANNAIGRDMWHHATSEAVSAAKSHRPDVPVLVNSVAFLDMPYRLAGEDPRVFEQYLLEAAARGAVPSTYIMGHPDVIDYECLGAGSAVVRFHRDHEGVYDGLVPSASTALVRPDGLRDDADPERIEEFRGLYQALVEGHVAFDVVAEERLADVVPTSGPTRYRLLVLPDLGPLDGRTVAALDAFTLDGGRILSTGSTGFDVDRSQLAACPVDRRVAVRDTPEGTWSSFLQTDGVAERSGVGPLPVVGALHVVEPSDGAEVGMTLLTRAPYGPPEKCYGHRAVSIPGRLRTYGPDGEPAGTWFTWTPGRAHRSVGLSAVRDVVVQEARRLLGAAADVTTDLPVQVEVVLGRSRAGDVVHLRNLSGATRQSFVDPLTIPAGHRVGWSGLTVGERVRCLRAGADVVAEPDPRGGACVVLPEIGLFEVLVGA